MHRAPARARAPKPDRRERTIAVPASKETLVMIPTPPHRRSRRPARRAGGLPALAGVLALALTALVVTALPATAAGGAGERALAERQATYRQVLQDPTYLAFKDGLKGQFGNAKLIDRYLRWLPISPLEMLQADMWERKYEIPIPRFIAEWHQRWQQLHGVAPAPQLGLRAGAALTPGAPAAGEGTLAERSATVGTNRNAAYNFVPYPVDYQGEVQVMVNPNNPQQIVGATNTWDDIGGTCGDYGLQAVFYSSDGGATWGHSCPPDDAAYGLDCSSYGGGTFGSDPAVYWDDSGNVYLDYMLLCATPTTTLTSMVVARSTDGGATWSARGIVKNSWPSGDFEDKNFYAIDNNPGSPHHGRHYTCWDRNNNEKLAYSDNAGATWTEVDLPTSSGTCKGTQGRFDLGCDLAIQKNGTVHVIFDTLACGATSCKCEQMYYTRSTNGGGSWSSPQQIGNFGLVGFSTDSTPPPQNSRGIGPMGAIDVDNSGGSCDGNLYVTYGNDSGSAATADIFSIRSTNGGTSWSSPVQVNDGGPGGNCQFHPFLVVDQSTGNPVVGWHDARNDVNNRKVDFFVDRSTDCGVSYGSDVQVSKATDNEFNNSSISWSDQNTTDNPNYNPNQYGEYLGLDAGGGKVYLGWSDTRHFFPSAAGDSHNEQENMGFAVINFGTAVCGNGTCEAGENCNSCPGDCIGGGGGATCGNGLCESGNGENCTNCAADCNGKTNGPPSGRFCCGAGDSYAPNGCGDSRCTSGGWMCTEMPASGGYCCGDGSCTSPENATNCAIDCS
jgi:hypothetical protein